MACQAAALVGAVRHAELTLAPSYSAPESEGHNGDTVAAQRHMRAAA
jgi:hypothetical protein